MFNGVSTVLELLFEIFGQNLGFVENLGVDSEETGAILRSSRRRIQLGCSRVQFLYMFSTPVIAIRKVQKDVVLLLFFLKVSLPINEL